MKTYFKHPAKYWIKTKPLDLRKDTLLLLNERKYHNWYSPLGNRSNSSDSMEMKYFCPCSGLKFFSVFAKFKYKFPFSVIVWTVKVDSRLKGQLEISTFSWALNNSKTYVEHFLLGTSVNYLPPNIV